MARKYIVNGVVYQETDSRKAIVGGGIVEETLESSWSVIDVDLDESIYDGQTGVVVTISGTVSDAGKTVWISQGANLVEQFVTSQTASTITITVDYDGVLTPGAASLCVRNPLNPPDGVLFVNSDTSTFANSDLAYFRQ